MVYMYRNIFLYFTVQVSPGTNSVSPSSQQSNPSGDREAALLNTVSASDSHPVGHPRVPSRVSSSGPGASIQLVVHTAAPTTTSITAPTTTSITAPTTSVAMASRPSRLPTLNQVRPQ